MGLFGKLFGGGESAVSAAPAGPHWEAKVTRDDFTDRVTGQIQYLDKQSADYAGFGLTDNDAALVFSAANIRADSYASHYSDVFAVRIDDGEVIDLPASGARLSSSQEWLYAILPPTLAAKLVKAMRSGRRLRIRYDQISGGYRSLDLPLVGFNAAWVQFDAALSGTQALREMAEAASAEAQ